MPKASWHTIFKMLPTHQSNTCFEMLASLLFAVCFSCSVASAQPEIGQPAPPAPTIPAAPQLNQLTSSTVPLSQALETRGDLSLQSVSIEKAMFTISATWRVNIVVGKDVEGSVSCIYSQAPLREVLDAILLANGYSYRAVGQSLVVQKSQDVGSANPLYESASILITHSDLDEVLEGARLLLSKQGQIRALPSAKSIVVVDYADRVASIRQFVDRMDTAAAQTTGGIPAESYQRLQVSYFHTQYIPVENAKEPVTSVLSQVGRVATMPIENRLVVVDYASNIAMVRRVLDKIDRPVPQVRITALIYDISLEDVDQLGFNWSSSGKGNNLDGDGVAQQALSLGTQTLTPFAPLAAGGTATVKSLTKNFDINMVGLFLQNAKDARLLANPNVTVMDNETAVMSSIQQIPFQQLTQSAQGGGGDAAIATTAFKDVGITLNVTPSIAADGTVRLAVDQEFSRLTGFLEGNPIIDSRIANTVVRVANRKTLVIGGLRQRSDTGDFKGIPYLKDVKFVGPLFRSRDTTVRESELVIFLMPEIVSYQEPPSQREFRAQDTISCRLNRIPMGEGCQPLGQTGGNCSSVPVEQSRMQHAYPTATNLNLPSPTTMHPARTPAYTQPARPNTPPLTMPAPTKLPARYKTQPVTQQQSQLPPTNLKPTAMRAGYNARYRSSGDTNLNRRSLSQAPNSVKSDSRALLDMLHRERK